MKTASVVLLVEDEKPIRDLVRLYFDQAGFIVEEADSGEAALEKTRSQRFDLVVLDLMLPKLDGWTVCREIRKNSNTPIIMLTARGEEAERILGFELGADDYVVKPFSPRELVARARALLRRSAPPEDDSNKAIEYPALRIDPGSREVIAGGRLIGLTPKEYDLLWYLASQPNQVFTREQLLEKIWGYDYFGELRTVDTHIKNLREKLRAVSAAYNSVTTVWGVGYKFELRKGQGDLA